MIVIAEFNNPWEALEHEASCDPQHKKVVILGAGGTAKAIAIALLNRGISGLTIANRSLDRAQKLVAHISTITDFSIPIISLTDSVLIDALSEADLVINTTSVGMTPNQDSPISSFQWVKSSHVVYDCVYNPPITPFLHQCQKNGATILGGTGMLVGQGAKAFTYFTGKKAPFSVMLQTAKIFLRQKE